MNHNPTFTGRLRGLLALLMIPALCQPLLAADYYVAPAGNDSNSGTEQSPFATIQHARDVVRTQAASMTGNITVHIGAGNYFIEEAVVFDDRDSGTNGHTITYQGAPNLASRIYGGRRITGWTQVNEKEYSVDVADLQQHFTLYENDQAANGGYYHQFADVTAGNWSKSGSTLTYQPRNLPIADQVVVLGTTKDVFIVMGRTAQQIVSNIVFDGLHMIGSDYTGSWPGGESDFPGYTGLYDGVPLTNIPIGVIFPEARHGQFYLRNAQNIVVRNSKLYGAGFMAAFIDRWAQNNTVENCWIENTGRDGLYFQGWEPGRGASDGITTLAASYCNKFNVVKNNVIYDIGRFGGSMGVRFDFSGDNRLEHNIIKGASGGAYHGHGWRPNMINILGYYVEHGMPASGIPYPYDQAHITFYDDKYVVTQANQGAELNHCRNNLIQYNDVSQSPRQAGDTGTITQWGAGPNSTWAYNAVHDNVALGGWCYFSLYDDDGSHKPTIKSNVLYWINATANNTAGIVSKGNFQINTGNIFADCVMGQGGANIGPFCEEATRATWTNNIVAAQVGAPYTGGGTQTPVQAVKAAYMIVGQTDTDANITSICGPNANTPYPIIQTAANNVYYYQPLDRADSGAAGAANLQAQVNGNLSNDTNSVYADPLFDRQHAWWDAQYTDYALKAGSPALARGFPEFDLSQIGLEASFPFNATQILGQSVSKIRAAGDYSRLLKLGNSGSQLVSSSGSSFPAGSWARYNWMDFGTGQYEQFQVHLDWALEQNDGTGIEIRLDAPDGTLIGTVLYGQKACRISATSGVHDVFLVFPNANVQTLDWFIFQPRIIWTGGGSDNNWTTATNWSATVSTSDTLYFAASSRTAPSNDFPVGTSVAGIAFDADAPAYTLGGNGITLTGNLTNSSGNDQTLTLPITLPGTGQIQMDTGAKRLTLTGTLSGAGGGIIKAGTGTLTLGTISDPGNVTIEGGTLVLTKAGLSRASTVSVGTTVGANAVLDLSHGLTERVFGLIIDGVALPDGSYGSSTSDATHKDGTAFLGTGMLIVQSGPCPPVYTTRSDGKTVATFSFAGSGTWTVPAGVTNMEVLVVGGGGGCWDDGFQSGSGAGGMYYSTSYGVTPGSSVGITVGAGATHGTGSSSLFGTQLIAYGGLKGNGYTDGGDQGAYSLDGGTTVVPGNVGGDYPGVMDGNWVSGGGAGHIGYKGDTQLGGAGAMCPITGSEVYYAGGGGAPSSYQSSGGTGYNVGGGASGPTVFGGRAFSGLACTGGGGGGGWGGGGGAGGSGVIIVAYETSITYTVTFNSNSGSTVATQYIVANGTAALPDPAPTKAGSTFEGWYSNSGLTAVYDFDTPITANTTLYAKWALASTYTLTYNADANGTITGTTPQTVYAGGNGTAVTAKPNTGYQFVKWSDNSTANPRTDSNVISNINVTASFELSTDTISPTSVVTRSDGKTVATFTAGSGTWTIPPHSGNLEVLVVGGGGSGQNWAYNNQWGAAGLGWGGGGGGGGYYYSASHAPSTGSITVTVGTGGAASNTGNAGGSSVFGGLTAYGGGIGAYGGAAGASGANNQGAAGRAGGPKMGGGGGAGQVGQGEWFAAPNNNGGDGLTNSITGTLSYYAGGGSSFYNGSQGGQGGGGSTYDATPHGNPHGADGLGGGGAAGREALSEVGKGGSGVVIVAYQVSAPTTPYDTWTSRYTGSDLTDPAADLDKDGLSNQQEFAFGLNPTQGASANPITAPLDKESHTFRYTRYANSNLGYTVETSTNLKDWAGPAAATQTVVSTSDAVETVEVGLISPPSGDRVFVRVKAQ